MKFNLKAMKRTPHPLKAILLEKHGLKADEIARAVGMSRPWIQQIMDGFGTPSKLLEKCLFQLAEQLEDGDCHENK